MPCKVAIFDNDIGSRIATTEQTLIFGNLYMVYIYKQNEIYATSDNL